MFLGVDGGGTKTAFCLVDRSGQVVARAQAASSYYFSHGIGLVERVLREGVDTVCAAAGLSPADIEYAFFGLPGYGEAARDLPVLDATPRAVLGHDATRATTTWSAAGRVRWARPTASTSSAAPVR